MQNNNKKKSIEAFRTNCYANGYKPVAVRNAIKGDKNSGKAPKGLGWNKTALEATEIPYEFGLQNTGIVCPDLYAIDVDVDDNDVAAKIEKMLLEHFGSIPLKRTRINTGRFLALYRSEGGIEKQKVGKPSDQLFLEVLSDGQQFVADGMHYSGVEIQWEGGNSPANFPKDELPIISAQDMTNFLIQVKDLFGTDDFKIHGLEQQFEKREYDNNSDDKISISDLEAIMEDLPQDTGYDDWVDTLAKISVVDKTFVGRSLAESWSQKSSRYNARDFAKKWDEVCRTQWRKFNGFSLLGKIQHLIPGWLTPEYRATKERAEQARQQRREQQKQDAADEIVETKNFKMTGSGLFYQQGEDEYVYVSSPFEYLGKSHDEKSTSWAHLISWGDELGIVHQERIAYSDLGTEQTDLFQRLRNAGLMCGETKNSQNLFKKYITQQKLDRFIQTSKKPGWLNESYLLPDGTKIGSADIALAVCEGGLGTGTKGKLEDWQKEVGARAVGNPHLMFSITAALAGPMIDLMDTPTNGGFHLFGKSHSGKTSALIIASSVMTGFNSIKSWRTTDNGLEATACNANDGTLFLDELGQMPAQVNPSDVCYMLANGQAKQRMTKTLTVKEPATWRLLYLSTGEHDFTVECNRKGKTVRAGNLVRHVDIPLADINITNLHGFASSRHLIDNMKEAAKRLYGTVGRAFLTKLTHMRETDETALRSRLIDALEAFISKNVPLSADAQVVTIARRFAMVAFAGELAIEWKILPWERGAALKAVSACFDAAINHRGHTDSHEDEDAIDCLRAFIQQHQFSRFKKSKSDDEFDSTIYKCAGAKLTNGDFAIYPQIFRDEICSGFDSNVIAKSLQAEGLLDTDKKGLMKQAWIDNRNQRMFIVKADILSDDREELSAKKTDTSGFNFPDSKVEDIVPDIVAADVSESIAPEVVSTLNSGFLTPEQMARMLKARKSSDMAYS